MEHLNERKHLAGGQLDCYLLSLVCVWGVGASCLGDTVTTV